MAKDRKSQKKPRPTEQSEDEQERPTVAPPFDPAEFAKEALVASEPDPFDAPTRAKADRAKLDEKPARERKSGKATPRAMAATRQPMPTLNDPGETENARQRSIEGGERATRRPTTPKPPGPTRRPTPSSTLSLANARIPSDLPPLNDDTRAKKRKDSGRKTARMALDEATSPPPPLYGENTATTKKPSAKKDEPPSAKLMNDRVALGDYTGALDVAERLLAEDPADEAAAACAENCRGVLKQMYTARIGPLDRVPQVAVPRDQLRWLSIDHRAGFVLSLIDGVSSLEMILDVSGMPELDALRILADLAQQRIITLR